MLVNKKGKSILRVRWGKPRGASSLVRISLKSRERIDALPERYRREFVDGAIYSASLLPVYQSLKEGRIK